MSRWCKVCYGRRSFRTTNSLHLRRQGWHLTTHRPVFIDPQVLGPHLTVDWKTDVFPQAPSFFEVFGDATARKLLRALISGPQTEEQLGKICGNAATLTRHLDFYRQMGFIVRDGDTWRKSPPCEHIDNLGSTLEWYVAQWFRTELDVPARHGVTIEGVEGDLDVVAFVEGIRVFVECKVGKPSNVEQAELRHFLQRAYEFNPEIAVFLVDTTSAIEERIITPLNDIYHEVARQDGCLDDASLPVGILRIEAQPRYGKGIYWGARHIYVVNTAQGIDGALDTVLRHYHARARHQRFPTQHGVWNFVKGTVVRTHEVRRPASAEMEIPKWAPHLVDPMGLKPW